MNLSKTLIVSHDAGGAFLLSKWCRDWASKIDFVYCLKGPAIDIFMDVLPLLEYSEYSQWDGIKRVITSTGWQTSFELMAIKEAREKEIYTVSYLDHWANYGSRFLMNNRQYLPDEIWVADKEAKLIAKKEFLNKSITYRYIRNRHLSDLKRNISRCSFKKKYILICLEPIRTSYSIVKAYDILIKYLIKTYSSNFNIILRDHPSKSETRIDYLIKGLIRTFDIKISTDSLENDLARSLCVIGYQSSVLVYSISLSIPTLSFYPNEIMEPILPHNKIEYISRL